MTELEKLIEELHLWSNGDRPNDPDDTLKTAAATLSRQDQELRVLRELVSEDSRRELYLEGWQDCLRLQGKYGNLAFNESNAKNEMKWTTLSTEGGEA